MHVCPKCGHTQLIVESSPDGKTRTEKCLKCGYIERLDTKGRRLLQEVLPADGQVLLG